MKFPNDKKTPLPYDKKPMKGNTLDYYNDDMSRKAVGRLFDDEDEGKPDVKPKPVDEQDGLEGTAEYIDLDELETYIQKKHVNISSVYDDTGEIPYDISLYQDKKKEKTAMPSQKPASTRPPGQTHVSALKPAQGSARSAPGAKPAPAPPRTSTLKRPPTKQALGSEKSEPSARTAILPTDINTQIKVAALVIVVVFLAILTALVYRMNSLSADLKAANELALQYDPNIEREFNELKIRYTGLQEENDRLLSELEQAPVSVPTPPTIASNNQDPDSNTQTPPPSQPTTSTTQGERTHVVAAGDTLSKISTQYYGTADYYRDIMRANNMTSDSLSVGDVIKIPAM